MSVKCFGCGKNRLIRLGSTKCSDCQPVAQRGDASDRSVSAGGYQPYHHLNMFVSESAKEKLLEQARDEKRTAEGLLREERRMKRVVERALETANAEKRAVQDLLETANAEKQVVQIELDSAIAEVARLRSSLCMLAEESYTREAELAEQLHSRGLGPTVCSSGASSEAREPAGEEAAPAVDLSAWVRSIKHRSATAEADEKATLQLEEFGARERLLLLTQEDRARIRGRAWEERTALQRRQAIGGAVLGYHSHQCAFISSEAEDIIVSMGHVLEVLMGPLNEALRSARIARITRIREHYERALPAELRRQARMGAATQGGSYEPRG
eukprot:TRINITY_DN10321_c0_g2_i1.p1 TRINITY_DN10321_c0_g2~~TRINITY_DN10321_c0_g2_i1.p1  ORF type:complete len:357 (+),score=42.30 TRINITY_DN10321_c0_g2_i1:92-1072(+)